MRNYEICDKALEYAIGIYLRGDENKEFLISKFGDKIELVKFLRNRAFEEMCLINQEEISQTKQKELPTKVKNEIYEKTKNEFIKTENKPKKQSEKSNNKSSKNPSPKSDNQQALF